MSKIRAMPGKGYDGTECVICNVKGVTKRYVNSIKRNAWVCRRHENKD